MDFCIAGAGPAGAYFAMLASRRGWSVRVYEAAEPGFKACGGAVPREVEGLVKLRDSVINEIRGFRVYVDGKLVGWRPEGELWGYLVDKRRMIEAMLSGVDVVRAAVKAHPWRGIEGVEGCSRSVIALGAAWPHAPGERIYAVQATVRLAEKLSEPMTVEFWFDSGHVGYYWFFPLDDVTARVGVGGDADARSLLSMLDRFLARHPATTRGFRVVEPARGAPIVVSGPDRGLVEAPHPAIGEAAGFVYPISGEGIRPALLTAKALVEAIEAGEDSYWRRVAGMASWMYRQRRLLEAIRRARPEVRAAVLESLPVELAVAIAMGTASTRELVAAAIKSPRAVARIVKLLLGGSG